MRLQCNILLHEGTHHVGVVPMSWPSICNNDVLVIPIVVDSSLHGVPGILNIIKIPPEIACVHNACVVGLKTKIFFDSFLGVFFYRHSTVGLIDRPGTGVYHGPARLIEPVPELWVALVHVVGVRIAAVQLDIVHAPRLKSVSIFLIMITK